MDEKESSSDSSDSSESAESADETVEKKEKKVDDLQMWISLGVVFTTFIMTLFNFIVY